MPYARVIVLERGKGNPFYAFLYAAQYRLTAVIYSIFPDPEAALLQGILLGDDSGLTSEVTRAFKITGTAPIIAISGFNIPILI